MMKCRKNHFDIDRIERRVYGSGEYRQTLVLANVKNKVTGVEFEDWVRPDQLRTRDALCGLINWGYDKPRQDAGEFKCKDAFMTVTKNDDDTFNIDGVEYENGYIMTFDSIPLDFVNEMKEKHGC